MSDLIGGSTAGSPESSYPSGDFFPLEPFGDGLPTGVVPRVTTSIEYDIETPEQKLLRDQAELLEILNTRLKDLENKHVDLISTVGSISSRVNTLEFEKRDLLKRLEELENIVHRMNL